MRSDVIYPVGALRENIEALKAVRSLCLTEPDSKAVHRLRTLTRRVEAQVFLLGSIAALPKHKKEGKRLRKELRELRQGAGKIRDLDVQRMRVASLAEAWVGAAPGDGGPSDSAPGKVARDSLQAGAAAIDEYLEKQRNKLAAQLQAHLQKHEARINEAEQAFIARVGEGNRLTLSAEELLACAGSLVSGDALLKKNLRKTLTEDELHSARKAAKGGRYLAEMMPRDHAVQTAARRYEALQDAGGVWHDDLELARTAKSVLGKKHALTVKLLAEERRDLRLYREALRAEARKLSQPHLVASAAAA